MAAGVEMTESEKVSGVCLNIRANDAASSLSTSRVPRRLRRRLSESKSRSTVEEIETKLKEADLRRQQFHELLSKKARAKTRNLIWPSSQEEDLSQRLEAKLSAAKQKRLNILVKSRMRLARLDKLRQVAKFGVESRHEKERTELGMKVESRVQKAEANRMHLLKAYQQRRAAKKEQMAQSLMRRMIQDRKYKESLKDNLEDRLQRAKRQRAEYLRQRGSPSPTHANSVIMHKRGETLSRKLARCWRCFKTSRGTTLALAKAYEALGINITAIRSMSFDHLAMLIESPSTIQATKVLLHRLETRFTLSYTNVEKSLSSSTDITHLLKQVVSPNRKGNATNVKVSRYPVRVVLCAYMILGHPDAVFIQKGERETALVESASDFTRQFELLMKIVMDGPVWFTNDEKAASSMPNRLTLRSQLEAFDKSWCSYLYCFVAWKVKDAKSLEEDLIRAACQLEVSWMRASKGGNNGLIYKLESIQKQVSEEQKFLRDQVKHLCGNAGLERMDHALTELRAKFLNRNSSIALHTVLYDETSYLAESCQSSSNVVPSLFGKKDSTSPIRSSIEHQGISGIENEQIVNEIVHEHHHSFADRLDVSGEDHNSIKAKVRETMEKAFWDGIRESVEQDEPDYSWVLKLMKEIRDELCEMSPSSWRQEIVRTIDVDTLSEVLRSGILDIDYLGRVLEFALVTLQKLSSPANDDEIKDNCQNLLKELGDLSRDKDKSNTSFTLLLIKGLRFVLRQIQILKRDISKARVKILEPLIKGPAGVEYLKKAFSSHYGPPNEALNSLPLTMKWISSILAVAGHEWKEYTDSISALDIESFSHGIPPTTLKTGGRFPLAPISSSASTITGNEQPECKGEKVDLLIRLGLVKLVHEIGELTEETLPETLKLNLFRLRAVQSQVQKIIVISISMLVLRQTLLTDKLATNRMDMESMVSKGIKRLSQLLDSLEDAGIADIIETINSECIDHLLGPEKLHARKEVMANMLAKSLRAGDSIFTKVSHAVYVAMRGVVFGGSGVKGMQLAELALKRVGAASLAGKVLEAAEVLVVVAVVSGAVHRPWYEQLLKESV